MKFVLEKTINRANRIDCRLLRGGLAKGVELRTTYLRPGPRVHVVPFFDSSLAFSYELGGVRKGSRLFLSDTVGDEDLGNLKEFVFKWQYLSGVGSPAVGIHEFLWPGYVYKEEPAALASLVERAFAQWREYVRDFPGTREDYKATLYHFDETIKCMLRSLIPLRDFPYGVEAIKRCAHVILPREADYMEDCDIRYIWGFWFQALLVLCTSKLVAEHDSAILLTKKELVRRGYLDNFMAESNYPDYKALKELFQSDLWRANRGTDESEVPPGFTPQL
jgi:hypothetical protein